MEEIVKEINNFSLEEATLTEDFKNSNEYKKYYHEISKQMLEKDQQTYKKLDEELDKKFNQKVNIFFVVIGLISFLFTLIVVVDDQQHRLNVVPRITTKEYEINDKKFKEYYQRTNDEILKKKKNKKNNDDKKMIDALGDKNYNSIVIDNVKTRGLDLYKNIMFNFTDYPMNNSIKINFVIAIIITFCGFLATIFYNKFMFLATSTVLAVGIQAMNIGGRFIESSLSIMFVLGIGFLFIIKSQKYITKKFSNIHNNMINKKDEKYLTSVELYSSQNKGELDLLVLKNHQNHYIQKFNQIFDAKNSILENIESCFDNLKQWYMFVEDSQYRNMYVMEKIINNHVAELQGQIDVFYKKLNAVNKNCAIVFNLKIAEDNHFQQMEELIHVYYSIQNQLEKNHQYQMLKTQFIMIELKEEDLQIAKARALEQQMYEEKMISMQKDSLNEQKNYHKTMVSKMEESNKINKQIQTDINEFKNELQRRRYL